MSSNVTGVVTAVGACAASAAITVGVAIAAPLQTGNALIGSVVIAIVGLVQGRKMAENEDASEGGERDRPPVAAPPYGTPPKA